MELIRFRRTLRQVLVLPIVACLILAGVLVWQIQGANFTVGLIEDSDRNIAQATLIEKLVVDEETGLRGYQVTSDSRFLRPYYDAEAPMQQAIAELQASAKPEQLETLKQFVEEHWLWHQTFAEQVIATVAAGGHETDDDLNLTGRARMDTMRAQLNSIVAASEQRRSDRIAQWRRQTRDVYVVLVALALAVGLLIGLFTQKRLESVSAQFQETLDLQRLRTQELFDSEQNLRTTLASIGD